MPIDIRCAACGKRYVVDDRLAGKKGRCKGCGAVLDIVAAPVAVAQFAPPAMPSVPAAPPPLPPPPPQDDVYSFAEPAQVNENAQGFRATPPPLPPMVAVPQFPTGAPAARRPASGAKPLLSSNLMTFLIGLGVIIISFLVGMNTKDRFMGGLFLFGIPGVAIAVMVIVAIGQASKQGNALKINRITLAMVIGGGVLMFFGINEWRLASGASDAPQDITIAQLEAKGYGDNAHVRITNCTIAANFVYHFEQVNGKPKKEGEYTEIFAPLVPIDSEYAKQLQVAIQKGDGSNLPPLTKFKVILKSDKVKNDGILQSYFSKRDYTGMIINKISSLNSEDTKLLKDGYPGVDPSGCLILEEGREPAGGGKIFAFLGGGLALVLVGLKFMLGS